MNTHRMCLVFAALLLGTNLPALAATTEPASTQPSLAAQEQALEAAYNDFYTKLSVPIPPEKRASLEAQYHALHDGIADLQAKLDAEHRNLQAQTQRLVVTDEKLQQVAATLDDQIQSQEVESYAADARMQAIAYAIKKASEQAALAAADDPVIVNLQKVVVARKEEVARVQAQVNMGTLEAQAAAAAEAALAEAKAQVELQRQRIIGAGGGDTIADLNKQMIELEINRQELQARLDILRQTRDRLAAEVSQSPTLQQLQESVWKLQGFIDGEQQYFAAPAQSGGTK